MDIITLYNQDGRAVAYIDDDGQSIYLYGGAPVAWLSEESIYSYSGAYLGWFEDGWVIDRSGHRVFFTDDSSGGPARPARQARPARGARGARPARGAREARPARPARSLSWSANSDESFFDA
jgi:hypothetical protein